MSIKISHEVPLQLLPWSKTINDYEYVLPYFYYRSPEYKEFYLQCKQEGRFSILDNGLFEGETYTTEQLVDLNNELKPDIFIVPDEWNDFHKTYSHAKEWSELSINPETKLMVVLQGEKFDEIRLLYKLCYDMGYRHFALNHSSSSYLKAFPHKNKLVSKMMGRIQLVNFMYESFDRSDAYVHLLGATLPQEFMYYKGYKFIKSVDTSNPILVGAKKETYPMFGLLDKPKETMKEFFDKDVMPNIKEIHNNVNYFRNIVNLSK
jgi:hypothetical protein